VSKPAYHRPHIMVVFNFDHVPHVPLHLRVTSGSDRAQRQVDVQAPITIWCHGRARGGQRTAARWRQLSGTNRHTAQRLGHKPLSAAEVTPPTHSYVRQSVEPSQDCGLTVEIMYTAWACLLLTCSQ
jgi:hypothetical protein